MGGLEVEVYHADTTSVLGESFRVLSLLDTEVGPVFPHVKGFKCSLYIAVHAFEKVQTRSAGIYQQRHGV